MLDQPAPFARRHTDRHASRRPGYVEPRILIAAARVQRRRRRKYAAALVAMAGTWLAFWVGVILLAMVIV